MTTFNPIVLAGGLIAASDAVTVDDLRAVIMVVFGGGLATVVAKGLFDRRTKNALADSTLVDAVKDGYGGVIVELREEQARQGAIILRQESRISYLEGKVDKTTIERDWYRERSLQLEEHLRIMNLPVPHPVPMPELPNGEPGKRRE